MATPLLNISGNERLDLPLLRYGFQDQPLGLQSDVLGSFLSRANAQASLLVLHGFATRQGIASSSASPAANQLQVSPGAGLLAYRQGAGAPLYGVMAALDGSEQSPQGLDLTYDPTGTYVVWLRMTYSDAAQTDRSFWGAADPGFEYAALSPVRKAAGWEIQALGLGNNPGAEWLPIARLSWTAPATQGGTGSITGLVDTRPLYFEGDPSASAPYGVTWGGANDRSADRSTYGVGDLKTFVDAIKVCIEDIKGPGLRRWWDSSVGGINVGFGPNTPTLGRVALGDAKFFLQGRTTATAGHAYLASNVDTNGNITGWDFASDRSRYLWGGASMLTFSSFGTIGLGSMAEASLFAVPNRSVVEIAHGGQGRMVSLFVCPRDPNGATPVRRESTVWLCDPDQTGNDAQVLFGRGGVQGTLQNLYRLGKDANNDFALQDEPAGFAVMLYQRASKNLSLTAAALSITDVTNNVVAQSYDPVTRMMAFAGPVRANSLMATTSVTGNSINGTTGNIPTFTCTTLQASSSINAPTVSINAMPRLLGDRVRLPVFDTRDKQTFPANGQRGDIFFDPSQYDGQGCIAVHNGSGWLSIELTA